jgi:NADH-quinone oxidoreductase subunit M
MPTEFSPAGTLLSLIIFLPALATLPLMLFPREKPEAMKLFSLFITAVVFLITAWMAIPGGGDVDTLQFEIGQAGMQNVYSHSWIKTFNIYYLLGIDGISFPLIVLTTLISMLAMWASWPITKNVKAYCILFLLLETGMLGVFVSLDFFLFYIFWEVMLLPMYFLIGVWGGPRREYAAIKFFLYTLFGSVLMLIAILMLYFTSDISQLSREQLTAAHVAPAVIDMIEQTNPEHPVHTFNILALSQLGQNTNLFSQELWLGKSLQWWAFILLFIGFIIKVPSVPLHTWLPDAHVEAPTPISMILAGVLLKLGGYGIIRICYPICPEAGYDLAWFVTGLGVLSMVYGAFAAMAQKDFKRLVAYSSVSHMGYVLLGLGVWSATAGNEFNPWYWAQGVNGAMYQMIAHGISSPGMFFIVGVIYERVHHRNLNEFGGLATRMPVYFGLSIVIFFAGLGLPGLCGFIGEVFVTLSAWKYSYLLAVISAAVVILTAGYILWTIQRVYLGAEYKGPHGEAITPITPREVAIVAPLCVLCVLLGVYPQAVFNYMEPSVNQQVAQLTDWTKINHPTDGVTVPDATTETAALSR